MSGPSHSLLSPIEEGVGYGSTPAIVAPKKGKALSDRSMRIAGAVSACALLGVVAMFATGSTAPLSSQGDAPITFDDVMAKQTMSYAAMQKSRTEGIAMLQKMTMRPVINVPNARARLGASDYEKCVAQSSKPSDDYILEDGDQIRRDLVFDVTREEYPAVTAYNDSKALLMGLGCEVPPPATFRSTSLCTDEKTKDFCNANCNMPAPQNCQPGKKEFGSCEPTVRGLCNNIELSRKSCKALKDQITTREETYDSLIVGALPCRTDPEAPFAQAAYAQMKYESAYLDWVDAVNDATEVCTIGHALWVHNLALYQAHYATITSTTNDLKAICAEEGAYDGEVPEDTDGNTTNSFAHGVKFDMSEAIADAEEGFFAPSKHHHFGRKLVWWQQLCEPTISAMEALCRSLEVETPQLQCFAETCQRKKATEEVAFDELVKAHNKFEIVFGKYTDEVHQYNDMISQKNTALATTISAYESFHPVQAGMTQQYDKDVYNFEKFDSGADKGHCGLSDCQVGAICSHKYQNDFEFWVDTEKCEATPHDAKMCHPPPSPPPPPPSPSPPPPMPPHSPQEVPVEVEPPAEVEPPSEVETTPESEESETKKLATQTTEAWQQAESHVSEKKEELQDAKFKLTAAKSAADEAAQAVLDIKKQLANAKAAAAELTGPAAMEALNAVEELKKQLADAETNLWEANEAVETVKREVAAAKEAHEDAVEKAKEAKVLVKAINDLAAAEEAVEKSAEKLQKLREENEKIQAINDEYEKRQKEVDAARQELVHLRNSGAASDEEIAAAEKKLNSAIAASEKAAAAVDEVADRALELAVELKKAIDEHKANERTVADAQLQVVKVKAGDIIADMDDTAAEAQEAWENAVVAADAAKMMVDQLTDQVQAAEDAISAAVKAKELVENLREELQAAEDAGDEELVAQIESQLAAAETELQVKKTTAAEAKSNIADLKAKLVAAEAAYVDAKEAVDEAKMVVDEITQKENQKAIDSDEKSVDALNAKWEAAAVAAAEAENKVNDIEAALEEATSLVEAAKEADAAVKELNAQIAEQEKTISKAKETQALVDELTTKLDEAQNADPVNDELVAQLQADLADANVENERAKAQAGEAAQSLASLKEELEVAVTKKEEANHAAMEAKASIDQLKKDLAEAITEQKQAQDVADAAKKMVETAIAVADATKKYEEAVDAVENIKTQIEEAKNADPVDEELVRSLENDLTTAESVAANHKEDLDEVLHKAGPVFQDKSEQNDERADAAKEFKQVRDEVATSSSVTQALTLPGYTKATFDDEAQVIFKKVIATVVETVDATITVEDIVIASVEDVTARRRLLQQTAATVSFVVYSDVNLDDIVVALNGMDLTMLTRKFAIAGLENLSGDVSVAAPAKKQVAESPEDKKSAEQLLLEKERADAAAEFKRMREGGDAVAEPTQTKDQKDVEAAQSKVKEAEEQLALAKKQVSALESSLTAAQERLENASTVEEKAKIQAQIDVIQNKLVTAESDVQKASQAVEDTKAWAVAAEEYSKALTEVAKIKNQLADAKSQCSDDSDKEAQAAACAQVASLHDELTAATVEVAEKKTTADITKSAVVETGEQVADKNGDADDESREATAAWEKASFDLSVAEKKAEEVKDKLAAARDAGDTALVVRLEAELEAAIKAVAEATVAEHDAQQLVNDIAAGKTAAKHAEELSEAKDEVIKAQTVLEDAKEHLDDLKKQLEEAEASGDQTLVDSIKETIEQAERTVKSAEQAVADAEDNLELVKEEHRRVVSQANRDEFTAEKRLIMAQASVHEAEDKLTDAKEAVEELQKKIKEAEASGDADTLAELKEQLSEAKADVSKCELEVKKAHAVLVKVEEKQAWANEPIYAAIVKAADEKVAEAKKTVADATEKLNEAKQKVETLKEALADAKASGDKSVIAELEKKIAAAENTVANAAAVVEKAEAQLEVAKKIQIATKTSSFDVEALIEAKKEVAAAQEKVEKASEALAAAKSDLAELEQELKAAEAAGDKDAVDQLKKQIAAADDKIATAEATLQKAADKLAAAEQKQEVIASTPVLFDEESHQQEMQAKSEMVAEAKKRVEQAKATIVDIQSEIDAAVATAKDPNASPEEKAAAEEAIQKLKKDLEKAQTDLKTSEQEHSKLVVARDAYQAEALERKAMQESVMLPRTAEDIAKELMDQAKRDMALHSAGPAPGPAPSNEIKIMDADGQIQLVPPEKAVASAQEVVSELKAKLLDLIARETKAAESGDAKLYASMKEEVALVKKMLEKAERAVESVRLQVHIAMAPSSAPEPDANGQTYVAITTADGQIKYVPPTIAADIAKGALDNANAKVENIKSDLLDLLEKMKTAANNGDATAYNNLKEKVEDLKNDLRVAEIKAEDSRQAYVNAVSQAPGYVPDATAMAPSSGPSILHQDILESQKKVSDVQVELVQAIAKMRDASNGKDKSLFEALKEKVEALKRKLEDAQAELLNAEQRLRPSATEEERLNSLNQSPPPPTPPPSPPPLPRYQGPPAVVSVDAKHVRWFQNPKGSITGAMGSAPGGHVEMAEIENVKPYPVLPRDGLMLNGGDLLLPPMRDMQDEAVSVAMRVKFRAAPLDNSCLFHMGDGEENMFRIKFQEGVLTFQATPTAAGGGMSKLATIAMEEDVHSFVIGREYTIAAILGNDGYMYLYVDGDKVAEGNGMVNELNGFIRDVTMEPRKDNYVGTCYTEPSAPLTAGIIAVDVFDGELSDLDVTMVSGRFTEDKNFVNDPDVEH